MSDSASADQPAAGLSTAAQAAAGAPSPARARRPLFLRRRTILVPTWRLWLLLAVLAAGGLWLAEETMHDWLAVTKPVRNAPYLAVEGWAPDHVVRAAADLAEESGVTRLFCTGIPLERGMFLSEFGSYADIAMQTLIKLGTDPAILVPARAPAVRTDRTRAMAAALRAALNAQDVPPGDRRINIVTEGTHARRTWYLFRKELGPDWKVGIISVPAESYDPENWWRSSEGAKSVLQEYIALATQVAGAD